MKKPTGSVKRKMRPLVPALAAVGSACGLAALPAGALELGDINVESALGQPLRASIAYALGPNEQLYDFCVYLRPAESFDGIPSVTRARVSVTSGSIVLTGNVAVRDPMLNLRLLVDCPYSPHLQREYLLMLSPGVAPREPRTLPVAAETVQTIAQAEPVTARSEQPAPRPAERPRATAEPLEAGSTYRVQTGDTVSAIAARVENRTVGLWSAVDVIVAANPEAFVDGDVNRLIAGSTLVIPALDEAPAVREAVPEPVSGREPAEPLPMDDSSPAEVVSEVPETVSEPQEMTTSAPAAAPEVSRSIPGMTIVGDEADAAEQTAEPAPAAVAPAELDEPAEPGASAVAEADGSVAGGEPADAPMTARDQVDAATPNTSDLKPGDVIMPVAEPAAVAETASRDAPVVAPTVERPADSDGSRTWMAWAGAGVLALFAAFLAFGRKLRDRFSPAPATGRQRPDATVDADADPTLEKRAIEDLDFNFDDPVVANAMSLDADLGDGSGLGDGDDVDVMQDFGFSADPSSASSLDHEISADFAREPVSAPTDVIPPSHRIEESSILESEVNGDELTGDYDLSMIVDATRQNIGDYDRTAQDLQAVRIDDDYTVEDESLNGEVDMRVLEQDYEDELSATQALNLEIEKAASELADRLEEEELPGVSADGETTIASPYDDETVEVPADDATAEMPDTPDAYELTAADKTMEMPASGDSDMTAELTASLPTDLDALNDESADSGSQRTVDIAAAGSDITVEMQVESGKVDTKKK